MEAPVHLMVQGEWGKAIKRRRNALDLSQIGLAELLVTDQGTVSRIERGKYPRMNPEMILRLCVALECQPTDICPWPMSVADLARFQMAAFGRSAA